MRASKDSMWLEILKKFKFWVEVNKALAKLLSYYSLHPKFL
jgi:hypothetical protein